MLKIFKINLTVIISILQLTGYLTLFGQNYHWATSASRLMTSSFCEFRPRHYHAAIDIKTWNRTGYKVFAIEDGHVMRIRVSAFGYGKAVYLKLKDGNIVVYAHLKSFSKELERFVDETRKRMKQYRVDLHLKSQQFPIKRGQMIGRTGRTGIGVPHLHFEIRSKHNHPINPLQFYSDIIEDNIPPRLYQLAVLPLDQYSLINLQADSLLINLNGHTQFVYPDTLFLTGKIGLALKTYDFANGAKNSFSFYRAKMWLDDSLIYSVQYDSFSYAQTALIELDKNFSLWRKGMGIFHNLFKSPANRLPHYQSTKPGGGIINSNNLNEGIHRLKIVVEDFSGNSSRLTVIFISGNPAALDYDLYRWLEGDRFLRIQSPQKLTDFKIYRWRNPGEWKLIPEFRFLGNTEFHETEHYALSFPAPLDERTIFYKFQGINENGIITFPLFLPVTENSEWLDYISEFSLSKIRFKRNWLELQITFKNNPVRLLNGLKNQIPGLHWFPVKLGRFQINIPADAVNRNRDLFFKVLDVKLPEIHFVEPGDHSYLYSRDMLFKADFPVAALYQETVVYCQSDSVFPDILAVEKPYSRIGLIYDLQPFDQPVNDGIIVTIKAPPELGNSQGLGLYYWDFKHGWTFIPSRLNPDENSFTATVTSLEKFTLVQDTLPPLLLPAQKIVNSELLSRNGYLTFVLKDQMAGIRRESQIQVYVNEVWSLFTYDPEEDLISVKVPGRLLPNKPELRIKVTDNVGNFTEKTYTVR